MNEQELEKRFPLIHWRSPQPVKTARASGLGCRFCIARDGLKSEQVADLPQSEEEFAAHMRDTHGLEMEP
jgi:hypothetical protein